MLTRSVARRSPLPLAPASLALLALVAVAVPAVLPSARAAEKEPKETLYLDPIDVNVPPIASDKSVKYDYDIVYVRAKRAGDTVHKEFFAEIARPVYMQPGADLMLLPPDGTEEVLVPAGDKGAVVDPV